MLHPESTFFFRISVALRMLRGVKRISVTFTKDSPVTLEMLEERARQLDRSVSDYILLVIKYHLGFVHPQLLVPPDGKLPEMPPELTAIVEGARKILKSHQALEAPRAAFSKALVKNDFSSGEQVDDAPLQQKLPHLQGSRRKSRGKHARE